MFEIGWSEMLLLAIVTLIFIGPKELPEFLRTLGRYAGVVKRHVGDIRAQFTVVMREAELDELRKELGGIRTSVDAELSGAKTAIASAGTGPSADAFQPEVARSAAEFEDGADAASNTGAPATVALPPMPKPAGIV